MKWFNRAPLAVLAGITMVIVLGMLYFGVRLKGYGPANGVEWLPSGEGLYFKQTAIAYTEEFFAVAQGRDGKKPGLTIEMLLRVEELGNASFRYIMSVHDGSDKRQLLIGQWRQWLIVMNGDDYDGKQGVPKIYADLGQDRVRPVWLSVVAGEGGTAVYMDGRLVKSNANLHLSYPRERGQARLVLGNSVYGKHAWSGAIAGLALYDRTVEGSRLRAHYDRWVAEGGGFGVDGAAGPEIVYRFDPPASGRVINQAADRFHLEVPALARVLKKEFLQWPRFGPESRWHMVSDVVLNLIGFVPLGFMLIAMLGRIEGLGAWHAWLVAIGVAFLFSLFLEVAQAWIPSRDSSLLDLMLNTVGAGVGGWFGVAQARCPELKRD